MEENKKKRGCNYTTMEKDILLDLVKKYQHILENKETNANMILKKRQAWDSLCQQFNAVAVSGSRSWTQLRHLYENLKQKSKKKQALTNRHIFYEKTKELKKKASIDKKQINCTGGGAYKSTMTEQDAQILAMVAPQINPLPNPYDDAALYFGDVDETVEIEVQQEHSFVNYNNNDVQHTIAPVLHRAKPCTITSNMTGDRVDNDVLSDNNIILSAEEVPQASDNNFNVTDNQEIITITEQKETLKRTENVKTKQKKGTIKDQYFRTKLRNAKIEQKYLINKNKMELNKYKVEMEILKLRLKALKPTQRR